MTLQPTPTDNQLADYSYYFEVMERANKTPLNFEAWLAQSTNKGE